MCASAAFAQVSGGPGETAADKSPTYDVSTIRPNVSGSENSGVDRSPSTLRAENVPMQELLRTAFGVPKNLVFGLPAWATSGRFDVNAKIVDPDLPKLRKLTPEQRRAMLRALYEERLGLKWHFETRVMPSYDLVLAKDGPKFKAAAGSGSDESTSINNSDLTAKGIRLSALTDILAVEVERPVVDKTGLAGKFDLHLKWTRDTGATSADAGKDADAPPPLFTALQEQLGLKLEAGKDPVQVVMIDHIEEPSAN